MGRKLEIICRIAFLCLKHTTISSVAGRGGSDIFFPSWVGVMHRSRGGMYEEHIVVPVSGKSFREDYNDS